MKKRHLIATAILLVLVGAGCGPRVDSKAQSAAGVGPLDAGAPSVAYGAATGSAAGTNGEIGTHIAYVNGTATSFRADSAADIIQMNHAAAAFGFQTARNPRSRNFTAISFDLHQIEIAGNIDRDL